MIQMKKPVKIKLRPFWHERKKMRAPRKRSTKRSKKSVESVAILFFTKIYQSGDGTRMGGVPSIDEAGAGAADANGIEIIR